jgi:uncharacterized Zn-finger protein
MTSLLVAFRCALGREDTVYKCQMCRNRFRSMALLQQHAEDAAHPLNLDMNNTIPYSCQFCEKKYTLLKSFEVHMARHNTETPGVFRCLHQSCKKLFHSELLIRKHSQEAHEDRRQFQCHLCDELLDSNKMLLHHLKFHSRKRLFKCNREECKSSFKRKKELLMHKENTHKVHAFKCRYCDVSLKLNNPDYEKHVDGHKTDKPDVFKCVHVGCLETFSDPKELKMHVEPNHRIDCDVPNCSFGSKLQDELQAHKKSEHNIWPYNCQFCGRGFDDFFSFSSHIRKSHKCPSPRPEFFKCMKIGCQETFPSGADLKKHVEEIHPGFSQADDYLQTQHPNRQCNLCGMTYKMEGVLKAHILRHMTKTPGLFRCHYKKCRQVLKSAADLKKHVAKHRERYKLVERPFACDFPGCASTFKYQSLILTHKKKYHTSVSSSLFVNIAQHDIKVEDHEQSSDDFEPTRPELEINEQQPPLISRDENEEVVLGI